MTDAINSDTEVKANPFASPDVKEQVAQQQAIKDERTDAPFAQLVLEFLWSYYRINYKNARMLMSQARVYYEPDEEALRFARVVQQAENFNWNQHGEYTGHWAVWKADSYLIRIYNQWPEINLHERTFRAKAALGGVASFFQYKGTITDAHAALDEYIRTGIIPAPPPIPPEVVAQAKADELARRSKAFEAANGERRMATREDELTKPWIAVASERGKFWADVNGDPDWGFNKHDETRAWSPEEREAFVHKAIGGKLHETKLSRPACKQRVLMAIKKHITEKEQQVTEKTAEPIAPVQVEAPKPTEATAPKSEPQTTVTATELPEAPFSANFHLFDKHGVNVQFTVRSDTVSDGVKRVNITIEALLKDGYTVERPGQQATQSAQPNGATSQAPANADRGTATCMLIKCVKSYNGGKPQLEFEVDGFDKPLRYTKDKWEDLNKVFSNAHHNGTPFTGADFAELKKFGGSWAVDWQKVTKDDKTFYNVLAVRDAA